MPPQVVFSFANFCIKHDARLAAAAVLLQYDLYLRPSEVLSISGRDIVRPVVAFGSPWRF